MKRDNTVDPRSRKTAAFKRLVAGAAAPQDYKISRRQAVLDFFTPASSPIWQALALGSDFLEPSQEEAHWSTCYHYNGGRTAYIIHRIWATVFPSLARIWWAARVLLMSWPLRVVLMASLFDNVSLETKKAFAAARLCCVGRGLAPLAEYVNGKIVSCDSLEVGALVHEIIDQFDFSIFEVEVEHHAVGDELEKADGNTMSLQQLSNKHLLGKVASLQRQMEPFEIRQRGRPRGTEIPQAIGTNERLLHVCAPQQSSQQQGNPHWRFYAGDVRGMAGVARSSERMVQTVGLGAADGSCGCCRGRRRE